MHRLMKNKSSVGTNTFHYQCVAECVYLQVFDYQMSKGEELKSVTSRRASRSLTHCSVR